MSHSADVRSVESLHRLDAALAKLQDGLNNEAANVQIELRKLTQWIEERCQSYWEDAYRIAKRKWTEARQNLSQCESCIREDEKKSCTEQKKILERATERVAICERKLRILKQCHLEWRQERDQAMPRVLALVELVETTIPLGRADLGRLIDPLLAYASATSGSNNSSSLTSGTAYPSLSEHRESTSPESPSTHQPSTHQPSTHQPSTHQPSTLQPSTDQLSTDLQSTNLEGTP